MGGQRIGRLGRWLMEPVGWWAVSLAGVATLVLLAITGWPEWTSGVRWVELEYYFRPKYWTGWKPFIEARWFTITGAGFVLASLMWGAVLLYVPMRELLRGWVLWRQRVPREHRTCGRRRDLILVGLTVVTALWFSFGWVNRLAGHFAERELSRRPFSAADAITSMGEVTLGYQVRDEWKIVAPDDFERIARFGTTRLWSTRKRRAALALWVEGDGYDVVPKIRGLIDRQNDADLRLAMLQILAVGAEAKDLPRFVRLLSSPHPRDREVAADAIGSLQGRLDYREPCAIAGEPTISVSSIARGRFDAVRKGAVGDFFARREALLHRLLENGVRERLWKMAIEDDSGECRKASRRALVSMVGENHSDYNLRVAEWGVWLADGARMKLGKKIIEEIPPFVHVTGDTTASMAERLAEPMLIDITKPVVHVTAGAPMCVALGVRISLGRPWYVYPMPDDYSIGAPYPSGSGRAGAWRAHSLKKLSLLDPPVGSSTLAVLGTGPRWLLPRKEVKAACPSDADDIVSWGVMWDGLLVTPEVPRDAKLAEVPGHKKFIWWRKLREVPSSYVSNRGEAERFIYYDGPTHETLPVRVELKGEKLCVRYPKPDDPKASDDEKMAIWDAYSNRSRDAFYVEVAAGKGRGAKVELLGERDGEQRLPEIAGDVERRFMQMLVEKGLTAEEGEGLMASWSDEFFARDGKRLILFLSTTDYDALCPMWVEPIPTERVRVGMVLVEF